MRPMVPIRRTRVLGLAAVVGLAACRAGGAPEATMTSSTAPSTFALTSPEFLEGGAIPRRYACDGDDVSPPLAWSGAPAVTAAMALVMDDPDAGGFVHWVVFDMPASTSGNLSAGWSRSAAASPQGTNSFGRVGYGGPCPPGGTHRYTFRLLALGEALALSGSPSARQVIDAAQGHFLGEARLTGTYRRGG